MALILDLKPSERVIIGNAVITNDKQRTRLRIDGEAPILREKDVVQVQDADTNAKKLYFILQGMYLTSSDNAVGLYEDYFTIAEELLDTMPQSAPFFPALNYHVICGFYYKAMKAARKLMDMEDGEGDITPDTLPFTLGKGASMMETQLLTKAAEQIEALQAQWTDKIVSEPEYMETLDYNRKLWMMFFDVAANGQQGKNSYPEDLMHNIVHICNFVFNHTKNLINNGGNKEQLSILVRINHEVAQILDTAPSDT